MIGDNHYKFKEGILPLEQVVNAMDGLTMIDSVRRGIIDYYVNGKTIKQTKVNSGMLIPYLRQVNTNITNNSAYMRRFLCTDEFSPRNNKDINNYDKRNNQEQ